MSEKTNLIWNGDRIAAFISLMVLPAVPLVMSITFLIMGGGSMPAALFVLAFGTVFALIVYAFLYWMWKYEDDAVQWLLAHPNRWLVHWRYDQATWQTYARMERTHQLFEAVASTAVMAVIGSFPLLMLWQVGLADVLIISSLVIFCLLGYMIYGVLLPYYRILNTSPNVYITRSELYIGGKLYDWRNNNVTILDMQLIRSKSSTLEFTLRIGSSQYQKTETVRIPVPTGEEEKAEGVVRELEGWVAV